MICLVCLGFIVSRLIAFKCLWIEMKLNDLEERETSRIKACDSRSDKKRHSQETVKPLRLGFIGQINPNRDL